MYLLFLLVHYHKLFRILLLSCFFISSFDIFLTICLLFWYFIFSLFSTNKKLIVIITNMFILSIILIMILPFILCRPFLAFISSVQGLNGSLRKAWKKSVGNYWRFIIIMLILNLPCFLIMQTDKYFELNGYLNLLFNSFYLVYYNLVFAKIYDFFYME